MISKIITPALISIALASCASQRKDPYDTGNLYGYPDAGAYGENAESLYDVPPAYEDNPGDAAILEPEDQAPLHTTHTVVRGDTLSKISRKYNVKMSAIISANNIRNKNLLSIGQQLIIPGR